MEWPNMKLGPIRVWPGEPTRDRQPAPFKTTTGYRRTRTPLSATLEVLERELRELGAANAELLIAMRPEDFRLDGKPRAQAVAAHPGVILSFDSRHGHLSYPCDTFTHWQDNLRAIALALEALRKVDRYGVTRRGEQYRGFLEIEPAIAVNGKAPFTREPESILRWLRDEFDGVQTDEPAKLLRRAKRTAHPDYGGTVGAFQLVGLAETYLQEAGRL